MSRRVSPNTQPPASLNSTHPRHQSTPWMAASPTTTMPATSPTNSTCITNAMQTRNHHNSGRVSHLPTPTNYHPPSASSPTNTTPDTHQPRHPHHPPHLLNHHGNRLHHPPQNTGRVTTSKGERGGDRERRRVTVSGRASESLALAHSLYIVIYSKLLYIPA